MYRIFKRAWYKYENGSRVPDCNARKTTIDFADTETQARDICRDWNLTHDAGPRSVKAEYTTC